MKHAIQLRADKDAHADQQPERLCAVGRPRGAGDAPAELENKHCAKIALLVQHQRVDHERNLGPADAVEEAEHAPQRHTERRAQHARLPELHSQRLHLRREAKWIEHGVAIHGDDTRTPATQIRAAHAEIQPLATRDSCVARRTPARPSLSGETDATEQRDAGNDRPVNGGDGRERVVEMRPMNHVSVRFRIA